jgi:hypothetical protein
MVNWIPILKNYCLILSFVAVAVLVSFISPLGLACPPSRNFRFSSNFKSNLTQGYFTVLASTEPHLLGIPKKKQVESISGLIMSVIVSRNIKLGKILTSC